jgi:hypothetical protein
VALLDSLIQPILDRLGQVFAPFKKLFDFVFHFWTSVTDLFKKTKTLVDSIIAEVDAWRNFKEEASFKNRLVSIPKAYDQTKQFILQIPAAWRAIVDLFNELKGKFETTGNPTEEAENALKDIESSGFRSILKQFPKFAKGFEKVLGFVAIIVDALESIAKGVDDLQAIVDTVRGIREEIESQQTIFLQQKNTRKTIKTKGGKNLKLRIGHLHSADIS